MKKILYVAVLICIAAFFYYLRHPLGEKAVINGHIVMLELAITEKQKEKGLGERNSLPENSGMLFVYQQRDRYGFWMKGMRFPLDYIWIDGNVVVDLSPNIPPPATETDAPVALSPNAPVNKVLEVNAGTIEKFGVKIGDIVQFIN